MDYYKILELNKNATKEEIKEAYKRLALKYHPDKHSQSPQLVRENATLRFKQLSEAYQILADDRKRADYNIRSSSSSFSSGYNNHRHAHGYGYGYGYNYHSYQSQNRKADGGFVSKFDVALRYLTTRAFLLNLAFAGALIGGMVIIDKSREALWKMHNSGKSFEEAMDSIEKAKANRHDV
ncbi:hypothetical protein P3X46_004794 [Hevea brasiliensis]|uniref:J domain-containing protein n=1 Tax=Hevea brasiliensis TaxID=3981 RepID=A0ABQ9MXV3_HEVBR|nr:chaperone protein dnaJ 72 [Hevea brasiliensis]KAJ9185132.1 hypothetical protein P3X46_004794 [Hevea brasiliensis]